MFLLYIIIGLVGLGLLGLLIKAFGFIGELLGGLVGGVIWSALTLTQIALRYIGKVIVIAVGCFFCWVNFPVSIPAVIYFGAKWIYSAMQKDSKKYTREAVDRYFQKRTFLPEGNFAQFKPPAEDILVMTWKAEYVEEYLQELKAAKAVVSKKIDNIKYYCGKSAWVAQKAEIDKATGELLETHFERYGIFSWQNSQTTEKQPSEIPDVDTDMQLHDSSQESTEIFDDMFGGRRKNTSSNDSRHDLKKYDEDKAVLAKYRLQFAESYLGKKVQQKELEKYIDEEKTFYIDKSSLEKKFATLLSANIIMLSDTEALVGSGTEEEFQKENEWFGDIAATTPAERGRAAMAYLLAARSEYERLKTSGGGLFWINGKVFASMEQALSARSIDLATQEQLYPDELREIVACSDEGIAAMLVCRLAAERYGTKYREVVDDGGDKFYLNEAYAPKRICAECRRYKKRLFPYGPKNYCPACLKKIHEREDAEEDEGKTVKRYISAPPPEIKIH